MEPETLPYLLAELRLAPVGEQAKVFEPRPEHAELKKCMESAGFEYHLESEADGDPRFSLSESDFAEQWGLGVTAQEMGIYPVQAGESPAILYLEGLTESERKAYDAREQECIVQVDIDVERIAWAFQVAEDFRARTLSDPRVLEAQQQWVSCMAAAGHEYVDRDDMIMSFTEDSEVAAEARFELEKAVAKANLSCEPAFREVHREVAIERFGEYQAALGQPVALDDQN